MTQRPVAGVSPGRPDRAGVSRRDLLRLSAFLPLSVTPLLLAACGGSGRDRRGHPAGTLAPGQVQALAVDVTREQVRLATAPGLAGVVSGLQHFTIDLHARTARAGQNWTISPLSMDLAFGMLRAGARGTTASQIDEVFGFAASGDPAGSMHPALNALTAALVTVDPVPVQPDAAPIPPSEATPVVAIANGLFLDDGFATSVRRPFLTLLASQYGAHPDLVSFSSGEAARVINTWVASQTRGRITRLFDRLDPDTLLVLANAVYFKADWGSPFEASATKPGDFTTATGRVVRVPLMRQTLEPVAYRATADYQRVDLPYLGGDLVMRVVLPTATGPAALTAAVAAAVGGPATLDPALVDLVLPKWRSATSIDLRVPLGQLGMADCFGSAADLSGIAPGLHVDQAVHRATITVDEKGTEAAAVTGIAIAAAGVVGSVVPMRVDRPFTWAIVHGPTGTPVFAGQVADPTAG